MKKRIFTILVTLLIIFIVAAIIIGKSYPYSFLGWNKTISFQPNQQVSKEYEETVFAYKSNLSSQEINASTKKTLQHILALYDNPIFMKTDAHEVSKKNVEQLIAKMDIIHKDIRQTIKENGMTMTTDQFSSLAELHNHLEVYDEWISNNLETAFVTKSQWIVVLQKLQKSLLVDLKEVANSYQ